MFGNKSSWFPVKNFTKSGCHFDWMMGATKFSGVRDFLTNAVIPKMATVFWNRTLNANVALSTYEEVRANKDPALVEKCKEIGLPLDIRVQIFWKGLFLSPFHIAGTRTTPFTECPFFL